MTGVQTCVFRSRERVDALRKAFMAAMADPDLIAEARRIQVDVMPVAGEELQAMIATLYRSPKDLLDKARAAYDPDGLFNSWMGRL